MKNLVVGLLGAMLLVSLVSAPTHARATVACDTDYTVAAGDWLSKLADKYLGNVSAYPALMSQTNLKSEEDLSYATVVNPDSIEVGWKLCIPSAETAQQFLFNDATPGLDKNSLYNATYSSELVPDGKVTVRDGKFSAPAAPDTPLMTTLELTGQVAYGNLNNTPSAAVVTGSSGGGSGFFYIISLMQAQDGKPVEVATTGTGDRSPVLVVAIQNNQLKVDYITQGPDQPMCCGNLRVVDIYTLDGNKLTQVSHTELGNLGPNGETPTQLPVEPNGGIGDSGTPTPAAINATPTFTPTPAALNATPTLTPTSSGSNGDAASLIGVVWQWQGSTHKDGTKLTPDDPDKYTIEFKSDGSAAIKADCNSGSGTYTVTGNALTFSPLISTLAFCGEGSLGTEYMADLQDTASYRFDGANLILESKADGTMTFSK